MAKTYSYNGKPAEIQSMIIGPTNVLVYTIKVGEALIKTCLLDKRFRMHHSTPKRQLVRS